MERLKRDGGKLVKKYLIYKEHVCRQVYADVDEATLRLPSIAAIWPEYKDASRFLMSRPKYLSARCTLASHESSADEALAARLEEGRKWLHEYLVSHV